MGSRLSTNEEDKRTTTEKISTMAEKENRKKRTRKNLRGQLKCSQDFLGNVNAMASETDLVPKNKRCRKSSKSLSNVTCQILTNKTSINRLQQTERGSYLAAFFRLFDDDYIQDFLWMDRCSMLCDKYLLAMVYAYFRRAKLSLREYTRTQFFVALYLAHEVEEDDEDMKMEIYPWAIPSKDWRYKISTFIRKRNMLLRRMKYRAIVSYQTCNEVFDLFPSHPAWQRERNLDHGGAFRYEEGDTSSVFSPSKEKMKCRICMHDEASSFTSGYVSIVSENTFLQDTSISEDRDNLLVVYDSDELLFAEE